MSVRLRICFREAWGGAAVQPPAQPADDGEPGLGRGLLRRSCTRMAKASTWPCHLFQGCGAGSRADVRRPDLCPGGRGALRPRIRLELDDVEADPRQRCPWCGAISAEVMLRAATVTHDIGSKT